MFLISFVYDLEHHMSSANDLKFVGSDVEADGRVHEGDPDDLCSGSCNPLRDCFVESARKGEGPDAQDRQRRQPSTRHTQQAATRSLLPSSLCGCGGVVAGVAVGGHGCSSPLCFNTTV